MTQEQLEKGIDLKDKILEIERLQGIVDFFIGNSHRVELRYNPTMYDMDCNEETIPMIDYKNVLQFFKSVLEKDHEKLMNEFKSL